jgi:uncharacterized protein (DUF433 family)
MDQRTWCRSAKPEAEPASSGRGAIIMTATTTRTTIERTEHPHVIKGGGLGGQPRIDDQRISVLMIYEMYRHGMPIDEILDGYPTLTPAQVHDAISYAYDHPDEMAELLEHRKLRSVLKRHDMVYVEGRLIPRRALKESDIPAGATAYTWETLPEEMNE